MTRRCPALRVEPVRVNLRHPRPCLAADCQVPAAAHIVWHQPGLIHTQEICAGHLLAFRQLAKQRGGGAVFFPLDTMPPLEWIARLVEREAQRRASMQQRVMWQTTGTGTSFNNGWGGTVFNVTFG